MWRFPAIFLCIHHKSRALNLRIQTSGELLFAAIRPIRVEVCCRRIGIGLDFRWVHGNSNSVLLGVASVPEEKTNLSRVLCLGRRERATFSQSPALSGVCRTHCAPDYFPHSIAYHGGGALSSD